MTAKPAIVPIPEAENSAQPATNASTEQIPTSQPSTGNAFADIQSATKKKSTSGNALANGDGAEAPLIPISNSFVMPQNISNKHWPTPRNVRELAGQANAVATLILNGKIDIEVARSYGALVRGIAQMMSIEVTRARFVRAEPILELEQPKETT